jgi:hypothetical protein
LLDRLDDRVVADALAVGQAPAEQDRRSVAEPRDELLDQTRLPHPGGSQQGEELTTRGLDRCVVRLSQLSELALAPDHQRGKIPWRGSGHFPGGEQSPNLDTLSLAFQLERFDRFEVHGVAH